MSGADQIAVRRQDGLEDASGDERAAELVLARLADARVMLATRPAARVTVLVAVIVLTIAGVWLRGHVTAGLPAVAGACAFLAAIGFAVPVLSGLGSHEPGWVRAARVHERSLESWVPGATLAIARQCLAGLSQGGRAAHLYVSRCTDPEPAHFGVCRSAGVFPLNGRVLVVVGEHVAAWPSAVTAAVLGHESRHASWWRMRVSYAGAAFALGGWGILGWAVPWPAILPAAIALRAALIALSWAIETSCDLGAARTIGAGGMLDALTRSSQAADAARAALPAWQRYTSSTLIWITGPAHPPFPVRRALIRTLLRHQTDTTA